MQNFLKLIEKSRKVIVENIEKAEKDKKIKETVIGSSDVFPLEYFMKIPNRMKGHKFYQDVQIGDVVIANITNVYKDSIESTVMCTMGALVRDIYTLKIMAICRSSELPIISNFCSIKAFRSGDKIKAIISKISRNANIEISMNELSPMNKMKETDLGLISDDSLPNYFKIYRDSYKSPSFFNNIFSKNELTIPMDIKTKMEYFNINENGFSLLDDINRIRISPNETAKSMRNSLLLKESMKYVIKGVNFYKLKKLNEANQCYNHALSINEENVDALVARGALRASSKAFESSIEDLEKAVKIDPNHKNAATYLSQTIIAYSKSLPESDVTIAQDLVKRSILLRDDDQNKHLPDDIKDPNKFIVVTDDETNESLELSHSRRKRKNKRKRKHIHRESKKCIIINTSSDESRYKKHRIILIDSSNDSPKSIKDHRSHNKRIRRRSSSSDYQKLPNNISKDSIHLSRYDMDKSIIEKKSSRRSSTSLIQESSKRHYMNTYVKKSRNTPLMKCSSTKKDSNNIIRDSNYKSLELNFKNTDIEYSSSSSSFSNELSHKRKYTVDKYSIKVRNYLSSPDSQKLSKKYKNDYTKTFLKDDRNMSKDKSNRKAFISRDSHSSSKKNLSKISINLQTQRSHESYKTAQRYDITTPDDIIPSDLTKEQLKLKKANDDIKQIEDFIKSLKQSE